MKLNISFFVEPLSLAHFCIKVYSEFNGGPQKDTRKNCIKKILMTKIATMVWSLTYSNILECEVRWALGSNTISKASGGDGISAELFQILKDDAVEVLHSTC